MPDPVLIVGDGLAGCTLALTCLRHKVPFQIAGTAIPGAASPASSGLINPITGRRYVKTWMIDELIEHAIDFYTWSEELLGHRCFYPVEIVRFLTKPEARQAWDKRLEDPAYTRYISNQTSGELDQRGVAYGLVTGAWRLDTPEWLRLARQYLKDHGYMRDALVGEDDQLAGDVRVIRSTGALGPPVAGLIPNKGEALIVRMPEWSIPYASKFDIYIIPLRTADTYWVGSYYERWPDTPGPSEAGRNALLAAIRRVYHGALEVVDHLAGVRPTTDDRRPLVGPHPDRPDTWLFTGLGTKGTSLAPYWAERLMRHLAEGAPLPSEVLPARFPADYSPS